MIPMTHELEMSIFSRSSHPRFTTIMSTIKVVMISGWSGCGKTSVANEIHRKLTNNAIPHASIEGDNLDMMFPEPTTPELLLTNLASCWRNLVCMKYCYNLIINGSAIIPDRAVIKAVIEDVCPNFAVQMKGFC